MSDFSWPSAHRVDPAQDPVGPITEQPVVIIVDGRPVTGQLGQSIAGVLLSNGIDTWRRTSVLGEARGLFCGIGVCFDCVVEVDGRRDVRACQRLARPGDVVSTQADPLPGHRVPGEEQG